VFLVFEPTQMHSHFTNTAYALLPTASTHLLVNSAAASLTANSVINSHPAAPQVLQQY
jgi:hypothetical protein